MSRFMSRYRLLERTWSRLVWPALLGLRRDAGPSKNGVLALRQHLVEIVHQRRRGSLDTIIVLIVLL